MGNLRDLKAFVRYDGSGRVVAGSLIFRKKKPTVGNFQQINSYKCCNYDQSPIVVNVTSAFPFSYPDLVVFSDAGSNFYMYNYGNDTTVNDIYELAAALNANFPQYGTFKVVGADIVLNLNAEIAAIFAAGGSTAIGATTFAD